MVCGRLTIKLFSALSLCGLVQGWGRFGDWSTVRGTFGANLGRAIVTNGDFTAYMCNSAATQPFSQITLGKLVIDYYRLILLRVTRQFVRFRNMLLLELLRVSCSVDYRILIHMCMKCKKFSRQRWTWFTLWANDLINSDEKQTIDELVPCWTCFRHLYWLFSSVVYCCDTSVLLIVILKRTIIYWLNALSSLSLYWLLLANCWPAFVFTDSVNTILFGFT